MTDHDVAILGGGPGGALTAALVRRQDPDRRVLVLERDAFPRHHVGESTIPSWRPILERAGVLEKLERATAIRKVGGRFLWGRPESASFTLDFRARGGKARRGGLHVDRAELDLLLLEHARSLGAEVRQPAEVIDAARRPDGAFELSWRQAGRVERATAAHVVDASGQARLLSRLLGIRPVPFDGMNNYAVWGYFRGSGVRREGPEMADDERWTLISTCDDGWAWHIPIAPDLVSVGLVTEQGSLPQGGPAALERFFLDNVRGCPEIGALLEGAELTPHPRAAGRLSTIRDWSYRCERVCGEGWFLVGDAAMFVDPILSTGLLITANGASMAASALHTLWTDPDVDAPLLRASYDATYREAGLSFHRLAAIWYSRNFKRSTWHWEAHRQRLRAGLGAEGETSAEAFFQLATGAFADPIEGALPGPRLDEPVDRPDARIMAAGLFSPEERAAAAGDAGRAIGQAATEPEARAAVRRATGARWSALLASQVRVRGCTWERREAYFTDRTMDRWTRVAFVEVRPEGGLPTDRLALPSSPALPDALLPRLDGRPLSLVLREALADERGPARVAHLAALRRQVLRLDLASLLELAPAPPEPPAALPPALAPALAGGPFLVEVDAEGQSVALRRPDAEQPAVMLAPEVAEQAAFRRTATGRLWYPGKAPAPGAEALLGSLAAGLRAWEEREPEAVRAWWDRGLPAMAALTPPEG